MSKATIQYFLLLLCLISFEIRAQVNLVPNPSFETITSCPNNEGQVYKAFPWTGPQINSTDLFNVCSNIVGVPCLSSSNCIFSYQYPRTGNSMAGINVVEILNNREYLQCKLLGQLSAEKCYFISCYSNLANPSKNSSSQLAMYVSYMHDSVYNSFPISNSNLSYIPQIYSPIGKFNADTMGWTLLSGIYQPAGGEEYITIGNFNDDNHLDTLSFNPAGTRPSYYFIDDVMVTEATPANVQAMLPMHDTLIGSGNNIVLGTDATLGITYAWYSNNTMLDTTAQITISPGATTTYIRKMSWCNNTVYDTVQVVVNSIKEKDATNKGLVVVPNPANNKIQLNLGERNIKLPLTIVVTDFTGKICKIRIYNDYNFILDTSDLANGIYTVVCKTTYEEMHTKIIIAH